MKLSREAIQRMVEDRVGGGGGAGGGGGISIDDIQGMGFATEQWVNEKYLSIDFFNRLFKAYDSAATPNQVLPNDLESTITNIKAMFGFWTEQFVSALGYSPGGGGGGGADLNALLDSINSSNIGDIVPTASEVGKCLVYNGNNQWAWATPGGGGGTGTVTSITAGTGLSGGTITTSGTIAISSTYQTRITHGETAYGWGNHADAGYLTSADLPALGISNGVITIGNNTITPVTQVAMTVPTGFTISGTPVTKSGTLALGFTSGYSLPTTAKQSQWDTAYSERHTHSNKSVLDGITSTKVSNWDTAYGWGNHADQGYLLRTEGMRFTTYDNYVAARFVTATGAYDSARAAKAQGDGYIEWWSSGGYFNHVMGFIRANGNVEVGTSTTDTAHYLQIGGGRLFWDNTNNALYVQKADGTAAHFYATGGVSALGMGVSGTASLNTLTLGTLAVTDSITVGSNGILISDPDGDGMIYSSGGMLTLRCDEGILANNELTVNGALYMLGNDILNAGGVYGTSLHSSGMVYLNQELAALAYNKNTGQLILRTRTSTSGAWTDHIISMN